MSGMDNTANQQVLHGHQHPSLYNHGHGHALPHAHMSSLPHAHMHDMNGSHSQEEDAQADMGEHGHMHLQFVHPHHAHGHVIHRDENGLGEEAEDDTGDDGLEEAEMHSDGGHPGDPQLGLTTRVQGTDQLTLTYQGEVYVFDTVPPEKVISDYSFLKCYLVLAMILILAFLC